MTASTASPFTRGGPYTFRDPLILARADVSADPAVVLTVVANFWPVTVDWGDGGATEDFAKGDTVDHTYATNATFTIDLTDANGGGTDSLDVTIAGA